MNATQRRAVFDALMETTATNHDPDGVLYCAIYESATMGGWEEVEFAGTLADLVGTLRGHVNPGCIIEEFAVNVLDDGIVQLLGQVDGDHDITEDYCLWGLRVRLV